MIGRQINGAANTDSWGFDGQTAPVTNGEWRAELNVNAGANIFPVEATETNFTAGTNAQKTTRTLTITVPGSAAQSLNYDLNGSLTADGTGRGYQWDGANRLVTILHADGKKTRFTYDGLSRRVKTVEENSVGTGTSELRQVWEGMSVVEERDASNVVTKRFFPEGEQQGALSYLYLRDHLGSVRELMTPTGTIAARYDDDPYGRRIKLSGVQETTFGYTGHYYHAASGLHLAPFRQYDANLGKWLSRDPIGESGGINLYGYVGNSPINRTDPTGLWYALNPVTWFDGGSYQGTSGGWDAYNAVTANGFETGAYAALDGIIPFADPFGNNGFYDPCADGVELSKALGGVSRNFALGATMLAPFSRVPGAVYHWTSEGALAGIGESGITASTIGTNGAGIYTTSSTIPWVARLMGAAATETAVTIPTAGVSVTPGFLPGVFVIGL